MFTIVNSVLILYHHLYDVWFDWNFGSCYFYFVSNLCSLTLSANKFIAFHLFLFFISITNFCHPAILFSFRLSKFIAWIRLFTFFLNYLLNSFLYVVNSCFLLNTLENTFMDIFRRMLKKMKLYYVHLKPHIEKIKRRLNKNV